LFFGADPAALAHKQLASHQARLEAYEALRDQGAAEMPDGQRLALDAGIGHEREYIRFWKSLSARR
jgi:hypothetical protein